MKKLPEDVSCKSEVKVGTLTVGEAVFSCAEELEDEALRVGEVASETSVLTGVGVRIAPALK